MPEAVNYSIGAEVSTRDGVCGTLQRIVIDPIAKSVAHLVVGPGRRTGEDRLVPIALVDDSGAGGEGIRLNCSESDFAALENAEETQFLSGAPGQWGYEQDDLLSLPHFGLAMSGIPHASESTSGSDLDRGVANTFEGIAFDKVPLGEVQIRRGDHVEATDGPIGHVRGLVIDPRDHHVSHFLLEEGHLWDKKQVAIPIGVVVGLAHGVSLNLSKDEVRVLPAVDVEHHE